jgi:hypothetical protein
MLPHAQPATLRVGHPLRRLKMRNLKRLTTLAAAALLAVVAIPAMAEDKAPMPETRGMQGMDPKLHDAAAKDPYEGCVASTDKAAQQAAHPMPDTKGMKGMDPKAHVVECPKGYVAKDSTQVHVHKTPAN